MSHSAEVTKISCSAMVKAAVIVVEVIVGIEFDVLSAWFSLIRQRWYDCPEKECFRWLGGAVE